MLFLKAELIGKVSNQLDITKRILERRDQKHLQVDLLDFSMAT